VVTVTLAVTGVTGIGAQTIIEPNSKPKLPQASGLAKSEPARRVKSCGTFGAGFVQIAGTDMCVKIGGYVSTEGTVNHGR
jgi:Porin subfamily